MTNDFLSEFQWNALLQDIEGDNCVICIGPEFYTAAEDGRSQSARLSGFLRQHAQSIGISVRENGWYHLSNNGDDWMAYEAVSQFYEGEVTTAHKSLQQLARINAHLFLSLTPDRHLAQAFTDQNFRCRFEAYVRNEPDRNSQLPTKNDPLVYNLVGDLEQRNSLVLTYDDFFEYIQSTFSGNSMSLLLKHNILAAEHLLFLGMPPDDWRIHLFMRVLKQHENRKRKFATMPGAEENLKESWHGQYGVRLINDNISGFLNELERRCEARGLIRKQTDSIKFSDNIIDKLKAYVAQGRIADCLTELKEHIKKARGEAKELMELFVHVSGQFRSLQDNSIRGNMLIDDELLMRNQIVERLISLINRLEEEAPILGIRL